MKNAHKTDKDSLRTIAEEINFLFRNGIPSDEDLDYDLDGLKSSLEAIGFDFDHWFQKKTSFFVFFQKKCLKKSLKNVII